MRGTNQVSVATQANQCWLIDLSSDLRLEEVLDRTIEHVRAELPGYEFALLIMVEDALTVVRTSGLGPGARRRLEMWARDCEEALAEPLEIDDLRHHADLCGLATRLSQGALRALPLLFKGRSLGVLIALAPEGGAFDDDARELLEAFTEQAAVALANAHLFQQLLENATHDALTELPNRREFDRQLTRELERSSRYGEIFSLAILDLDSFKQLNDTRGHQAGDEVLRRVAATLREQQRAYDVAARYGGEEFALIAPGLSHEHAVDAGERIRAAIAANGCDVTASIGVATFPHDADGADALVAAADAALYASKHGGRNRVSRATSVRAA
jgi:diguanylate cyclase (GGDEF)-like protein